MVSAIAGIDGRGLSIVSVLTNSVARCWASAALPPLPQIRSLPPRAQRCHQDRGGRDDVVQALLLDAPDGVRGRAEVAARLLASPPRRPSSSRSARPSRRGRRPHLVAAGRADTRRRGTRTARTAPRGARAPRRTAGCADGTAVQQEVPAAARTADLAAGGARPPAPSTSIASIGVCSAMWGFIRRFATNASRSIAPSSSTSPSSTASRIAYAISCSCFMPRIVSSRPSRYSSICVSISPTFRRTNPV